MIAFRLNRIKWWFLHRFHPRHRYHVIRTGLRPGWHDRDSMMAHLIVQMLIEFVEREHPFDRFDIEASRYHEEWMKLKGLYDYFKANDVDAVGLGEDYRVLTGKLVEVVELRKLMWT